jgi:hypothetical protein
MSKWIAIAGLTIVLALGAGLAGAQKYVKPYVPERPYTPPAMPKFEPIPKFEPVPKFEPTPRIEPLPRFEAAPRVEAAPSSGGPGGGSCRPKTFSDCASDAAACLAGRQLSHQYGVYWNNGRPYIQNNGYSTSEQQRKDAEDCSQDMMQCLSSSC